MNIYKKNIYILSGPSGVGKSTIANRLLSVKTDIVKSISYTTRQKRISEVDGVDYYFIGKNDFDKMVEKGEFIENVTIYNNNYGTTFSSLDKMLSENHSLMVIDMIGAKNIKIHYPQNSVLIYILPPSYEELENRLMTRGCNTSKCDLEERLDAAKEELKNLLEESYYDYAIINDTFDDCFKRVISTIDVSTHKLCNMTDIIGTLILDFRDQKTSF
jgi:guanylate kinase